MNPDGSGQTRLTDNPDDDSYPSWSPDGTKIAFASDRDGNYEIFVMNADGTGQTRLTDNPDGFDYDPSWSPDGTKIAFAKNLNIYVMNADGTGQTSLTGSLETNDFSPSWLPDGEKIAFTHANTGVGSAIYVMNADDGSDMIGLTDGSDPAADPSWSPDGTKIAFMKNLNIYVMNADGTGQSSLTDALNHNVPDWGTNTSPAGGGGNVDTTPPVLTVPEDITEEATGPDGAQVSFEVSAEDAVDGPTDVECDHNSGETFPIGETVVTCSAEDLTGNPAEESFTITVQDTTAPEVEITQASDRRNDREIAEGSTTNMRYIEITFEATDAVGIDKTECSVDGQPFTSCTSPVVYDRLSREIHQFTVRATDAAGNIGEDQFTWTVNNPSAAAPGRQ